MEISRFQLTVVWLGVALCGVVWARCGVEWARCGVELRGGVWRDVAFRGGGVALGRCVQVSVEIFKAMA